MGQELDHKLDCKKCGTISLKIPEDASEATPIHCSNCGMFLGTWGDLQDDFIRQSGRGVFDVKDGTFYQK